MALLKDSGHLLLVHAFTCIHLKIFFMAVLLLFCFPMSTVKLNTISLFVAVDLFVHANYH